MAKAFLLLGSNTGNSKEIIENAVTEIEKSIGKIISQSSKYITEPWGLKDQPNFINQLIIAETNLSPGDLLRTTSSIEKKSGRDRIEKWGPRTLDIDILYYGNEIVVNKDLKIPHPEIQNRKFVLIPLVECAPGFIHPVFNITSQEMLKRCSDNLTVEKLTEH